jgi:hypothetical protein
MMGALRSFFKKKPMPSLPTASPGLLQSEMPLDSSEDVTNVFAQFFHGHGLDVSLVKGWIVADDGCLIAQARILPNSHAPDRHLVQLDLEVRSRDDVTILESIAGFGHTPREAVVDAIKAFAAGSFHVIFSALSGKRCSHCETTNWMINGLDRNVFLGPVTRRGSDEILGDAGWFPFVTAEIRKLSLPRGTHSIRFYHADGPELTITEFLIDGMPNAESEARLAKYAWTPTPNFYSVRLFLIIKDAS